MGACGINAEADAREVQPPPGPYQILSSPAPDPTSTGASEETVCLIKDGTLVTVTRRTATEPTLDDLISDLTAGPTPIERKQGLGTALTGANTIDAVTLDNGIAAVSVGPALQDTGRNDGVLAFGQIVCTLDAHAAVKGVTFVQLGEQIGVPRGDGSLSRDPLTTGDYANLLARRSTAASAAVRVRRSIA